jgi:mannose-6-phosphate isomerase
MNTSDPGTPFLLEPNPVPQFYAGGGKWLAFRGVTLTPTPSPEDWLASTTSLFGRAPAGQTLLPDGRWLADAVAAEPVAWLGSAHVERYGADAGVLVKLLDSAERLVVHCHPDRSFARAHLGCAHGKTEAWIVLSAGDDGAVWLGFEGAVERSELESWIALREVSELLGALNRISVADGDTILVPAGVPHAIGAGVLVLELQEPEDLSIMLERPAGSKDEGPSSWHLGLGAERALAAVDRSGWSIDRLGQLRTSLPATTGSVLPRAADPFFRAEHVVAGSEVRSGFRVIVGIGGEGRLVSEHRDDALPFRSGAVALAGDASGSLSLTGSLRAIICRPPSPDEAAIARPEISK